MSEEGGRPLRRRDVVRIGLIAFFAICTAAWADITVLRIFGAAMATYYGVGFILAVLVKSVGGKAHE